MRVLLLLLPMWLLAHPLNITKIWLDFDQNRAHLRFVIFNIHNIDKTHSAVANHLHIQGCTLIPQKVEIHNEVVINAYYKLLCKPLHKRKITFDLFFDQDPTQQGVCKITDHNKIDLLIFSPKKRTYTIQTFTPQTHFATFLKEGIRHIFQGTDHLLFLLLLIIPIIFKERSFFKAFLKIFAIATLFSIAHSITLFLNALHILTPPPRLIEVLIAITILLTALNNLYPLVQREGLLAFGFGLIHGFGFAGAMQDLHLSMKNFIMSVASFNIGIEIGQFLVILALLPFLWLIRSHKVLFRFISLSAMIIACYWIVQRSLGDSL
ncbi:HupE/UreJ family protein [Nitratiruptor sp. SB155-2]|uniref:HupE/UreJ family protein n=1 Tax=Nitratiruptor sp. (strain SB155-2) TaxID=387092 RepID=UPI0001586F6E|nr:HupE/UreJ family protein [Nitratiruptor sp. SB155-2]BAF69293.1 conserved hypothetical protein [Nitratiruptor sp. SB155-2]